MIVTENNLELLIDIFLSYKKDNIPKLNEFTKIYTYKLNNCYVAFVVFDIIYEKCEIIDIFVKDEFRRNNIASELIKKIEENFDIDSITLEVSTKNIPAISLYNSMGFNSMAIRKKYYKNSDAILMLKEVR